MDDITNNYNFNTGSKYFITIIFYFKLVNFLSIIISIFDSNNFI